MLKEPMDLLIVVGGYNSSNTSHLAEMGENVLPTYFIKNAAKMQSDKLIVHYDQHEKKEVETRDWLPAGNITVGITAGASCPNNLIEDTIRRLFELRGGHRGAGTAWAEQLTSAICRLVPADFYPTIRDSGNALCPRTRQDLERIECQTLAPYAQFSGDTRGREHPETPPDWRTHYQRDRDRVIHSRAFRRL